MSWNAGKAGRVEVKGPQENRVFVGNISWRVTWKELKDHMRQVGDVAFADIIMEKNGRSRGCGIVAYHHAKDAERAIKELQDTELLDRQIWLREDREAGGDDDVQERRVYVGNLPWSCTWKELKDHCRSVGEVLHADVICEGGIEGGRSKGYGIVEFSTSDEAKAAVSQLTDSELLGRSIFVREDRERVKPQQVSSAVGWSGKGSGKGGGKGGWKGNDFTMVFVGNLPFTVQWQHLKDHMRCVGDIQHVEIFTDMDNKPKGSASVEYTTFGAARRAVEQLHDSMLQGRMILVREFVEAKGGGPKGKGKSKGGGKGKEKGKWHRVDRSSSPAQKMAV